MQIIIVQKRNTFIYIFVVVEFVRDNKISFSRHAIISTYIEIMLFYPLFIVSISTEYYNPGSFQESSALIVEVIVYLDES